MKNQQITIKLRQIMADDKAAKIEAIGCILDNYSLTNPNMDLNKAFNDLYELDLYQLNDILSDLISQMYFHNLVLESVKRLKNS
jgi:hypothetical protein